MYVTPKTDCPHVDIDNFVDLEQFEKINCKIYKLKCI